MPTPAELAEYTYIWGMAAAVIVIPTGLVLAWLLCRDPEPKTRFAPSAQAAVAAQ